jgi:hypothetical protein
MNLLTLGKTRPISQGQHIYDINSWFVFSGICLVYLFSSYYLQQHVLTEELYYNSLSGVDEHEVEEMIHLKERAGILGYIMVPVTTAIKILFASFCLYTGLLLTGNNTEFRKIFKITLFAEVAFVFATLLRLVLLAFFTDLRTFEEIRSFAPLSLYGLFGNAPDYLVYPLQTINLFEIIYVFLLAAGLQYFLQQGFKKMLLLVVCSYGLGLLAWMVFVGFLNVNFLGH